MNKFYSINTKSFQDYEVVSTKDLWEKVKADGYTALSYESQMVLKEISDNSFDVTFSTADEDRHGDIVEQNFDLKDYKKNPVFLDSHNYGSIEHIIGRVKKIKSDKALTGVVEFALMNPKGVLAYEMAKGGFLNTTSIGFIPLEFDKDGKILKSHLLEISAVSVPANAKALFEKIAEEVTEEIEALEKEFEENVEPIVAEVIETKKNIDKKRVLLNSIRRSLQEMNEKNLSEKRTQVMKALRSFN